MRQESESGGSLLTGGLRMIWLKQTAEKKTSAKPTPPSTTPTPFTADQTRGTHHELLLHPHHGRLVPVHHDDVLWPQQPDELGGLGVVGVGRERHRMDAEAHIHLHPGHRGDPGGLVHDLLDEGAVDGIARHDQAVLRGEGVRFVWFRVGGWVSVAECGSVKERKRNRTATGVTKQEQQAKWVGGIMKNGDSYSQGPKKKQDKQIQTNEGSVPKHTHTHTDTLEQQHRLHSERPRTPGWTG